jgi:hypothetical protein
VTSVKIFLSSSDSFAQRRPAMVVLTWSVMWPVRTMFFWT